MNYSATDCNCITCKISCDVAADIRNFSLMFKPVALRMTKILQSFGRSVCNRVKTDGPSFFSTEISGKICTDMYSGDMIYRWS